MNYDLTKEEVANLLQLIRVYGRGIEDPRKFVVFANCFGSIVEKLDPEGWADVEKEYRERNQ